MNRLKMALGRKGAGASAKPATPQRVAANEETTVLTPVSDGTGALDRIPLSVKRRWIVVAAGLGLLLIASVGFNVYLARVSGEWQARSDETVAQNYDLGERLSAEQEHVIELQGDLDVVNEQLDNAQQRIIELVDDANQHGDDAEFYTSQIDDLNAVLSLASGTANALASCIEYQQDLVGYLHNEGAYDAAELEQYEADVNVKCDAAMEAHVQLQQLLAE